MSKETMKSLVLMLLSQANIARILYAIGVIAMILAGIVLISQTVTGVQGDERVEEILSSRGIIERSKQTEEDLAEAGEDHDSPLEKEAKTFAKHLDREQERKAIVAGYRAPGTRPQGPSVRPKLKVFGTSYFEACPEMSLALIDEPGKSRRWVRQSSTVGRVLIEHVMDGLVVVKSNNETFELSVAQGQKPALAKDRLLVPQERLARVASRPLSRFPTKPRYTKRSR